MATRNTKQTAIDLTSIETRTAYVAEYNALNQKLLAYANAEQKFNAYCVEHPNASKNVIECARTAFFDGITSDKSDIAKRDEMKTNLISYGRTLVSDDMLLKLALGTSSVKRATSTGTTKSKSGLKFTLNGEHVSASKVCELLNVPVGKDSAVRKLQQGDNLTRALAIPGLAMVE